MGGSNALILQYTCTLLHKELSCLWNVYIQFHFSDVHSDTTDNLYYQLLRERKENLLTNRLPYNGFEEMIKLTNEGKMWHYPIDNEQGTNGNLSTSVQKFFCF